MKHATKKEAFARKTGGVLIAIAHGVLIAGGLTGMAAVADDAATPTRVSYVDTRFVGPFVPSENERKLALAEAVKPASVKPARLTTVLQPKAAPASKAKAKANAKSKPQRVLSDDDLSPEMARVRDWVAGRYRVSAVKLEPALAAAEEAGKKAGIDPLLIVAIMAVESSFNPRAVSRVGALGLMQVMPQYHQDKMGSRRGRNQALFEPEFNVHVGTKVLDEGLRRYGSMQRALQYYNGSLKDPQARYTRKVMSVKQRLTQVAGRSPTDV